MRTTFSMSFRIAIAILLGIFFAIYVMQYDARFKKTAERGLKEIFGLFFDCHVEITIQSIRILVPFPYIITTNVCVTPIEGNDWKWECERFVLSLSWFNIIFGSKIGIKSDIRKLKVTSLIRDNKICITDHINKIIYTQRNLPFELRTLQVNKGRFLVYDGPGFFRAQCAFDCDIGNFNKRLQTIFYISDGTSICGDRTIISDAELRISCDVTEKNVATIFTGMLHLPFLDQLEPCYIQGTWKQQHGSIRVYNKNGSLLLDRCFLKLTDQGPIFSAEVQIPLAYIQKFLTSNHTINFQGDCHINVKGKVQDSPKIDSKVLIKNMMVEDYNIGDVEADITYVQDIVQGSFTCKSDQLGNPSGTWEWSIEQQKGAVKLYNTTDIKQLYMRYWHIAPEDFSVTGTLDALTSFSTRYACHVTHTKLGTTHTIEGEAIINHDDILVKGNIDTIQYTCQIGGLHDFSVKNFVLSEENKDIVSMRTGNEDTFEGKISYDGVRSLVKKFFNYDVQGHGTINVHGSLSDKKICTDITMKKGNIRLGSTYNFIQNFTGTLVVAKDEHYIDLKDCCINLHRGRLLISYARCLYNSQKHLEYCYLPLHLQNVFLNIERDVFILISGRVVIMQQKGKSPIIKGNLFIERGQIRHNIFSVKEQKNVLRTLSQTLLGSSGDVEFDITIETKHPVHVQTGFLESEIKLQLSIQGSLQYPHISGKIFISDGMFHFPYRPLHIIRGIFYIMPHDLDNPAIELHAKGKVKRYTISMYVHGTLQDPHITFVSTPPLGQEQIITLLLGGSETGSLSFVMPSLIMRNVQNLVFGSEQVSSGFEKYVLSPLRYIRIVPIFTDQTGRGGFRGAIEIDVSDQLRAVIQKNFSLSEDTHFEVEYQVSDEISLRGLKDERGDIGGEIEIRFTF